MNKIFAASLALLAIAPATLSAQEESNTMIVNLKNGSTLEYQLSDIQNIRFREAAPQPQGINATIAIPSSFTSGWVQKVMLDGKQVAELCREYIKALTAQRDVIYPCDDEGKADLTKGMTTLGETVVWDLEKNTATVIGTPAAEVATTMYLADGAVSLTPGNGTKEASLTPDVIVDRRGTETNTYTIVKIATQYWMAENLRATKYIDGTAIASISETDSEAWSANTAGAYLTDSETDWVKIAGYLYNGYTVTSSHGIAPAGWAVPTRDELVKLRSAGSLLTANFKDSAPGTWSTGTEGNNITGFSAVATGYYSTATNLTAMFSDTYFWSSTTFYDAIFKKNGLETFRILGSAKNTAVSTQAGHDMLFGHCIRCIRR